MEKLVPKMLKMRNIQKKINRSIKIPRLTVKNQK